MSTKDDIKRETHAAQDKLHEASETLKSSAEEAADEAQRTAYSYAERGRAAAAGGLTDFATAIRRASDELNQRDQDIAARLVSQAASSLEDIANTVSHTSIDDVMGSVQGFARRNPAAFVGGAVLAGLAVGRFLRATGPAEGADTVAAPAPVTGYRPAPSYSPASPVAPANSSPK
ncbi:hypothetical protein DLJ53_14860 [Acuticoccus sediminis]|uniref:ElaB/YqjD/DUF883 family membrane-anchored ribosome-binding protein n=1 Tax=Acuticoccus sediminis TaxID=2184697 RepID=A0A8B2NW10_9HYPH|nr:hypothetical protein [Acuticoccus sediminis]RAI00541.1 hypothetical protein DLJ53_14860 [Acuticoccus sediminis]